MVGTSEQQAVVSRLVPYLGIKGLLDQVFADVAYEVGVSVDYVEKVYAALADHEKHEGCGSGREPGKDSL